MHRTSSRMLLIVAAFVLFLVPVAAIAAGGFTDVEDDSVFKTDIEWLADAGVTRGCNPPTNDRFCPEGNVTREQMSAFMHRLAVNKVVDAKTAVTADNAMNATNADKLDGKDSTAFAASGHDHDADYLATADKAADSDRLDGKDSTEFAVSGHDHDTDYLGIGGKAADADLLDGKDSTAFAASGHDHDADYLALSGKATDSDLFDGEDSSSFLSDGTPPVGTTARGNYALGGTTSPGWAWSSISWGFEMPSVPTVHWLVAGSGPTTDCPGTPANPDAAQGHLCFYESQVVNGGHRGIVSGGTTSADTADVFGAVITMQPNSSGEYYSYGTWAITVGTP